MLYWAYGSNLSPVNMRNRCPSAKRVGPLPMGSGRLVFRGIADVTSDPESVIQGGVWRITAHCERELDRYEGVTSGLYLKKYLTLRIRGKVEQCLYYKMNARYRFAIMPPSESYIRKIAAGYEYFGLDMTALEMALQASWENKNPTEWGRARYKRNTEALARRTYLHTL